MVAAFGAALLAFVSSWVWYDFCALVTACWSAVIVALSLSRVVVWLFCAAVTAFSSLVTVPCCDVTVLWAEVTFDSSVVTVAWADEHVLELVLVLVLVLGAALALELVVGFALALAVGVALALPAGLTSVRVIRLVRRILLVLLTFAVVPAHADACPTLTHAAVGRIPAAAVSLVAGRKPGGTRRAVRNAGPSHPASRVSAAADDTGTKTVVSGMIRLRPCLT
jgi:hypothetical protein